MTETKQKLPEWFKGSLYTEGLIVENPFQWRRIRAKQCRIKYV